MTLPRLLRRCARMRAASQWILDENAGRSFGAAYKEVERAACALIESGLREGDRVAVVGRGEREFGLALCAVWVCGAAAVPLSSSLPDIGLRGRISGVGAKALIEFGDIPASISGVTCWLWRNLSAAKDPGFTNWPEADPEREALLVYTSGSTGQPRAAILTHRALMCSATGVNERVDYGDSDLWLMALPLFHVGGVAVWIRSLVAGGRIALATDPACPGEDLARWEATHVSLVPTQLRRVLDAGWTGARLPSLRCVLLGGAAAGADLIEDAEHAGIPLRLTYGCTEAASAVTITATSDRLAAGLAGRPCPGREVRLTPGGEIEVGGSVLFNGYADGSGGRGGEGWYRTGDLGRWDEDERLWVVGRRDAMFVTGGENVYPEEVERAIRAALRSRRVTVVGVEDRDLGTRAVAFVDPVPQDSSQAVEQIARHLPRQLVPRIFLEYPPDSGGLKVDRAQLARIAAARCR